MTVPTRFIAGSFIVLNVLLMCGCDWFVSADQRVERAREHVASGEDGVAFVELKKAVKSEPENVQAHLLLADVALRLGDLRSAEEELKAAQSKGATPDQTDRISVEILLAKGQYDDVLERAETGLRISEAERLTYRGHAFRGRRKLEEAATAYRDALKANPDWAPAQIGLAETLAAQGHSDQALAHLDGVLKQDAGNALAWFARGSLLGRRGDFELAEAALLQAKKFAPGDLTAAQLNLVFVALVESELGAGKIKQAQQSLNELVTRAAATPLTHILRARIAMAERNYALAVAEAQKATAAAPQLEQAKLLLGAALMAQGSFNQAEAKLSEVVRASPENVEARKMLAQVNLRLQRPDVAAQVLAPVQEVDAGDPQLDALLGLANLQQGQSAAAIDLLEKSSAAQPDNVALKLDLAMAYLRAGQAGRSADLLKTIPADAQHPRRDILLVAAIAASQGSGPAGKEIERFVSEHPKDVRSLTTAAELHARLGNLTRARELLDQSLTIEPRNVSTLMARAEVMSSLRDFPAAHRAVDQVLEIEPANSAARIGKATIALREGDEATAIAQLEQVRKTDPKSTNALLMLAQTYSRQKRFADADKAINEAVRSTDVPGPVYAGVAQIYLESGKYEQALARFRDAIRTDPNNPTYYVGAARAQMALGNVDGATESVASATKARPNYVPAVAMAVMLDLRAGRQDAAAARVAALKSQNPKSPAASMLQGDVFLAGKSFEQAAAAYADATEIAPSSAAALREYRARAMGRLPNAAAPLEAWLKNKPDDVPVRLVLAEDFAGRGETRRAIEQYERLAKAPQPNAMALNNLAWLYHEAGDPRAAATAERAYELAPNVAAIADTLGWILVQSGDKARGLSILKAAAAPGAPPEIRYHYGVALAESGDQAAARREFEAIIREAGSSAAATKAREFLTRSGG